MLRYSRLSDSQILQRLLEVCDKESVSDISWHVCVHTYMYMNSYVCVYVHVCTIVQLHLILCLTRIIYSCNDNSLRFQRLTMVWRQ